MIRKISGYALHVEYLAVKKQILAVILSRASLNEVVPEHDELQVNVITQAKYTQFQQITTNEVYELYCTIQNGWYLQY